MRKLTTQQERFCQLWVEHGIAVDAYVEAYDCDHYTYKTKTSKASMLMRRPNITARINELREQHAQKHRVTADSLIKKLDKAYDLAERLEKPQQMVAAVLGVARITGFDKQIIEHKAAQISLVVNRP
jgi:phage terminase small subunit